MSGLFNRATLSINIVQTKAYEYEINCFYVEERQMRHTNVYIMHREFI